MKPNVLACTLAAAAVVLLPNIPGAAPPAHARQHKPGAAKSHRRSTPVRRFPSRSRAFILNGAIPGGDPNRMDPMAAGRGMHPEQIDHMNAATPAPPVPTTPKRLPKP